METDERSVGSIGPALLQFARQEPETKEGEVGRQQCWPYLAVYSRLFIQGPLFVYFHSLLSLFTRAAASIASCQEEISSSRLDLVVRA